MTTMAKGTTKSATRSTTGPDVSPALAAYLGDRSVDPMVRIKMAAVYLFATRGYAATYMREICGLVNLTTAGLYHHVAGKEALLAEIMRSGQTALNSTAESALEATEGPAEEVVVLATSLTAAHAQNLLTTRVTDGELRSLDPASSAHAEIMALRDVFEARWRAAIQEGVATDAFHVGDPSLVRLATMAMCTGTSQWYRPDGPRPIEEVCIELSSLALTMLGASAQVAATRVAELVPLTLELVPAFDWDPASVTA
jgi:TetR/AcrR family transcriptional regulator, cholesterol catabolism regulator